MKPANPETYEAIADSGNPGLRKLFPKERPIGRQLIDWLVGLSIAFVVISYAIQTWIVLPAFAKIEQAGALKDIERCVAGLDRDLEALSNQVTDWAWWDDTYDYVSDRNADYSDANLVAETFSSAKINVLGFYNSSRELVWGEIRDLESMDEVSLPKFWKKVEDPANQLIDPQHLSDGVSGIMTTSRGPLMFSSRGIRTSRMDGPLRGALLMGRFLDEREIVGLARRLQVELKSWELGLATSTLAAEELKKIEGHSDWSKPIIVEHDQDSLHAYVVIHDILDQPALLLRADVPREVTAQGRLSRRVAMLASLVGGLLLVTTAGWVIRKRVVTPLETVAAHAERVGREDDMKARLNMRRPDEIGVLAKAFDDMVMNLGETRKKVLNSAHKAGMSDVATEVLHNVGNVVNSASAAVEVLSEDSKNPREGCLGKAIELLGNNPAEASEFFQKDPRAGKLIEYFTELNSNLHLGQVNRSKQILRLSDSISHMRTIVTLQEAHTTRAEFLQDVDVSKLAREILRLNRSRLLDAGVEVRAELDEFPEIPLNRGKLSQVLMNLVKNSVEAMEDESIVNRKLLMLARYVEGEGVRIGIYDTGCGVSEENKSKLFTQGFSTKSTGHGIGLHFCANAIRSMGATLTAESEGEGKGSAFIIWIPKGDNWPGNKPKQNLLERKDVLLPVGAAGAI